MRCPLLFDMAPPVPSLRSSDALAHFTSADAMSVDRLFSGPPSAPLLLPADWDLASIESSLSPDPSLDDLLLSSSCGSAELELELNPLQLSQEFSAYIRYQFENAGNDSVERLPHSPANAMANPQISSDHQIYQRQQNLLQARRNAQIALRMSPYRKLQERLQTVQRRQMQQKTKRKFSLKNGPIEQSGAKREATEGRFRGNSNSSARRWLKEMGAMVLEQKRRDTGKEKR